MPLAPPGRKWAAKGGGGTGAVALVTGLRGHLALLLTVLTATNLACTASIAAPYPALRRRLLRRHVTAYRRHAARAFWSFVNVAFSSVSLLSPNLAILAAGSLAKLAVVTAPGAILAPIRLLQVMFQSTLRAEFSHLVHQRRRRELVRLYAAATGIAALLCGAVGGGAWAGWPLLYHLLFARGYDYGQIREATLLSIGVVAVTTIRFPGAALLNALNSFAISASTWAVVAPLALAAAIHLTLSGSVAKLLYAPLGGELIVCAVEAVALSRALARLDDARPVTLQPGDARPV